MKEDFNSKGDRITSSLANAIARVPHLFIIVLIILTLFFGVMATRIDRDTTLEDYFPETDVLTAKDRLNKDFYYGNYNVLLLVKSKDGNVFTRESLIEVKNLENAIRASNDTKEYIVTENDPIGRGVISIVDYIEFNLMNMSTSIENATDNQLNTVIHSMLQNPELSRLVSSDLNSSELKTESLLIVISLNNTLANPDYNHGDETPELKIKDLISDLDLTYNEVYPVLGLNDALNESTVDVVIRLLPLTVIVMIVILFLSYQGNVSTKIKDVLLTLLSILITLIWMFGIIALLQVPYSVFMAFTPILVIALGIDYAIHALHRYHESILYGLSKEESLHESITHVGLALSITTITTVIAFFSNMLSYIPAVRWYGLTVGIGIFSAFIVMGLFLPTMKYLFNSETSLRHPDENVDHYMPEKVVSSNFVRVLLKKPMMIFVISIVAFVTAFSFYQASLLETNFDEKELISKDTKFIQGVNYIDDNYPNVSFMRVQVVIDTNLSSVDTIKALEESRQNMEDDLHIVKVGGTARVAYLNTYIKAATLNPLIKTQLGITDLESDGIPDTDEDLKKVLDYIYANGTSPLFSDLDVKHVLYKDENGQYTSTTMWIDTKRTAGKENKKELTNDLDEDFEPFDNINSTNFIYTGGPMILNEVITKMTDGMKSSISISLFFCLLVLVITYRSIKQAFIAILPVCLVAIWTLASIQLFGFSLNLITVTITAMTIGVGVDYCIHILQRYKEERAKDFTKDKSLMISVKRTAPALLGAGATTALGYAVLVLAPISLFVALGIFTALMISYCLLVSIIFLPVLIKIAY